MLPVAWPRETAPLPRERRDSAPGKRLGIRVHTNNYAELFVEKAWPSLAADGRSPRTAPFRKGMPVISARLLLCRCRSSHRRACGPLQLIRGWQPPTRPCGRPGEGGTSRRPRDRTTSVYGNVLVGYDDDGNGRVANHGGDIGAIHAKPPQQSAPHACAVAFWAQHACPLLPNVPPPLPQQRSRRP